MEFNGLLAPDFDFFRKKDKMSKEDYEKGRNDVKLHFRGLCYEIQKIHHKKTNGVLELEKDFQNFNRRSSNISAAHIIGNSSICIYMNSDGLGIESVFTSVDEKDARASLEMLRNRKNILWEYMMSNKFMQIYAEAPAKDKKSSIIKVSSLDINTKNYDNLTGFIEGNIDKGKNTFRVGMGYAFSRSECIKQGKAIANTAYDSMNNIKEMLEKV